MTQAQFEAALAAEQAAEGVFDADDTDASWDAFMAARKHTYEVALAWKATWPEPSKDEMDATWLVGHP